LQADEIVSMSEAIRDSPSAASVDRELPDFSRRLSCAGRPLRALREGHTLDLRKPIERVAQVPAGRAGDGGFVLELCEAFGAITEDYFTKMLMSCWKMLQFSTLGSPCRCRVVTGNGTFVLPPSPTRGAA